MDFEEEPSVSMLICVVVICILIAVGLLLRLPSNPNHKTERELYAQVDRCEEKLDLILERLPK